jgi:hypothetical protein
MRVRNRPHWKKFSGALQQYDGPIKNTRHSSISKEFEIQINGYTLVFSRYEALFPGLTPRDHRLEFQYMNNLIDITKYVSGLRKSFKQIYKTYKKRVKEELNADQLRDLALVENKLLGIEVKEENKFGAENVLR